MPENCRWPRQGLEPSRSRVPVHRTPTVRLLAEFACTDLPIAAGCTVFAVLGLPQRPLPDGACRDPYPHEPAVSGRAREHAAHAAASRPTAAFQLTLLHLRNSVSEALPAAPDSARGPY